MPLRPFGFGIRSSEDQLKSVFSFCEKPLNEKKNVSSMIDKKLKENILLIILNSVLLVI